MKSLHKFLLLSVGTFLSFSLSADTIDEGRAFEDQDIRALKEWIDTKRQVTLKEIGGDLSISGEVRSEFQNGWESINHKNIRGYGPGQFPSRSFDVEVNLMLDYRTDRTWASIKIEFNNNCGIFSGDTNKIALERAYWGVRLVDTDTATFDIETGRRFMSSIFDSKIEFGSMFDGILFRYDQSIEKVGEFYIHAGPLVVNDTRDHFAYAAEVALLSIGGTGFYAKGSTVDWDTKHYEYEFANNRFRFIVSQSLLGYRFKLPKYDKIGILYAAALYNFAARRLPISNNERANWGCYVGFSLGKLYKQWDWAIDVNYQWVAAQAIPEFDVSGIGIGNSPGIGFYSKSYKKLDKSAELLTVSQASGNTNYKGFVITCDLLLTDKLDMQQIYTQSVTLNDSIGPHRSYKQYEIEFIYSW